MSRKTDQSTVRSFRFESARALVTAYRFQEYLQGKINTALESIIPDNFPDKKFYAILVKNFSGPILKESWNFEIYRDFENRLLADDCAGEKFCAILRGNFLVEIYALRILEHCPDENFCKILRGKNFKEDWENFHRIAFVRIDYS